MSAITTHILDTANGRPAKGVKVTLEFSADGNSFERLGEGVTDDDGRNKGLLPEQHKLVAGTYRLTFKVGEYLGQDAFFDSIPIQFKLTKPEAHYHVPLLLSPFSYSTYRGS